MRNPSLAAQATSRILEELNRFNLSTRQTRAAAERRFTEQRLRDVQAELRAAEDELQRFLQRNRDFRNSPVLVFEQDRLAREVAMKQQLYTTLAQAVEQAKIDEVRDTPVITIIERPEVPVRPDSRGLIKKGVVAILVGGIIGVLLAFVREVARNTETDGSEEAARFVMLKNETNDDLRHPFRALWRLMGFGP
jgi:tyrosine-protein kinase Etk/Wzc